MTPEQQTAIANAKKRLGQSGGGKFTPSQMRAIEIAKKRVSEVPEGQYTTWDEMKGGAKKFGNELLAESPIIAAATGGAIMGGSVGGPAAPVTATLGAIAGGTLGALSKETVEQLMLKFGLIKEGDKLVSDTPVKKKSYQEALEDSQKTGLEMGVGEGAGQAIIRPFTKMARGASKSVLPEQKKAYDFWEGASDPKGRVMPSPAQFTESRGLDIAHNVGKTSYVGGSRFIKMDKRATQYIDDKIKSLYSQPGHSKEQLGKLLDDAIESYEKVQRGASGKLRPKGSHQAFNEATDTLYTRLDELAGKQFVDMAPVASRVRLLVDEVSEAVTDPTLLKRLQDVGRRTVGPDGNLRQGMRFSEAQSLRSDILDIARKGDKGGISDKATGRAKKLAAEVHELMGATAKRAGVEDQWLKANKFYEQGVDTFNDELIRKIVKLDPDQAVEKILDAGTNRPVTIRRIKRAIRGKKLIKELENKTLEKIIFKATDVETGFIKPKAILTELKKFGGTDGRALKMMFPSGKDKVLKRLADIKDISFRPMPDKTGIIHVQLAQPAAVGALATGGIIDPIVGPTAGAILLLPEGIAKLMTSPKIVDFLIKGAKARPGLKQSVTFMTRLAALLQREKIPFEIEDTNQINEVPQKPSPLMDNRPRY